ncbi:SRPBCC family protein [Phenylobacterium sp. J426]|uniref:SRPBCC family protein n=1 Tax=Phenylobacterium sp. J426 TaxID=2898439 RepID=UPI0021508C10|nr:SRPBCC family protein [Phenylobacterium sp. J426]MCR5874460.1 SRPBCC family protein [Phenylobacterium sp. J426]
MKAFILAAAALAVAPAAAHAGDYVSIVQEAAVKAPAETVWKKVGGYCDIGAWMKTTCEITQGTDREVGALRKIAGRVEEVIVARTPLSYTYADVDPKILYHGTVEVRPVDARTSKIVYTLFFDQASIPAEQREANKTRRAQMFAGVLKTMVATAEAP